MFRGCVRNMHEIIIDILTVFTAIASCIAAIASWYSASSTERHFRKLRKIKYDVVLIPYEKYQNLPLGKFRSLLHEEGVTEWLDGDLQSTEVDGKMYFTANLKWDKAVLNQLFNKICGKEHFERFYITKQGEWNGRNYF